MGGWPAPTSQPTAAGLGVPQQIGNKDSPPLTNALLKDDLAHCSENCLPACLTDPLPLPSVPPTTAGIRLSTADAGRQRPRDNR